MSSTTKFITILFLALVTMVMARPIPTMESATSLAFRLRLNGNESCWDSLFELQSCTGELIMFFLNGEAHLGRNCCRAIDVIGHQCWPAMIGSLGFTAEEGDILLGYCDHAAATAAALPLATATEPPAN